MFEAVAVPMWAVVVAGLALAAAAVVTWAAIGAAAEDREAAEEYKSVLQRTGEYQQKLYMAAARVYEAGWWTRASKSKSFEDVTDWQLFEDVRKALGLPVGIKAGVSRTAIQSTGIQQLRDENVRLSAEKHDLQIRLNYTLTENGNLQSISTSLEQSLVTLREMWQEMKKRTTPKAKRAKGA